MREFISPFLTYEIVWLTAQGKQMELYWSPGSCFNLHHIFFPLCYCTRVQFQYSRAHNSFLTPWGCDVSSIYVNFLFNYPSLILSFTMKKGMQDFLSLFIFSSWKFEERFEPVLKNVAALQFEA